MLCTLLIQALPSNLQGRLMGSFQVQHRKNQCSLELLKFCKRSFGFGHPSMALCRITLTEAETEHCWEPAESRVLLCGTTLHCSPHQLCLMSSESRHHSCRCNSTYHWMSMSGSSTYSEGPPADLKWGGIKYSQLLKDRWNDLQITSAYRHWSVYKSVLWVVGHHCAIEMRSLCAADQQQQQRREQHGECVSLSAQRL